MASCPAPGPLVTPTRRPSELPALGGYGRAEAGGERGYNGWQPTVPASRFRHGRQPPGAKGHARHPCPAGEAGPEGLWAPGLAWSRGSVFCGLRGDLWVPAPFSVKTEAAP